MRPIFKELSQQLEEYIKSNGITGRLPGVHRLSQELNVNHITLSKAIRVLEHKGILTVNGTRGTFINKKENNRPRHRMIGWVGLNESLQNKELLVSLNRQARLAGYQVIGISFDEMTFHENPKLLLNFPVDGFIFRYASLLESQHEFLKRENIPVISTVRKQNCDWLDMIDCDHDAGYKLLLDYLKKSGHRRIAFLEFDRNTELKFYLEHIKNIFQKELGEDFDPALFYIKKTGRDLYNRYNEKYRHAYVIQFLKHVMLLPEPPTAIVTLYEMVEIIKSELKKINLKVPEDVSIVAVQHRVVASDEFTSVFYDEQETFDWSLGRLLKRLNGIELKPECRLLPPRFINGSSSGIMNNKWYSKYKR